MPQGGRGEGLASQYLVVSVMRWIQMAAGRPTLAEVARRMAASTRAVQRRLAEHGTTWRAELGAARQQLAGSSGADRTALARRLGYADSRSVRRAFRQWESRA